MIINQFTDGTTKTDNRDTCIYVLTTQALLKKISILDSFEEKKWCTFFSWVLCNNLLIIKHERQSSDFTRYSVQP